MHLKSLPPILSNASESDRLAIADPVLLRYAEDARFRDWIVNGAESIAGLAHLVSVHNELESTPELAVCGVSGIVAAVANAVLAEPRERGTYDSRGVLHSVVRSLGFNPLQQSLLNDVLCGTPGLIPWLAENGNAERLCERGVVSRLVRALDRPSGLRSSLDPASGELRAAARLLWLATRAPTPMTVVAVVGAGASAPLLKRSPDLQRDLIEETARDIKGFRAELDWLREVYGLNPEEFETVLAALSRTETADDELRRVLSEKFQVQYPVLRSYELVAHLLKHRFIDAVVGLNFDELLDTSLLDELGAGEHRIVVSDRDCVDGLCTDADSNSYIPLFFKLHGTASDPSTLRFTRESYYRISPTISSKIQELVGSSECVVVNLGSRFEEQNVIQLFSRPRRLRVFNLSFDQLTHRATSETRRIRENAERPAHSSQFIDCSYGSTASVGPGSTNVVVGRKDNEGTLLEDLCETLSVLSSNADVGAVSFRSLGRHRAVVDLLGETALLSTEERRTYLENRACLEAAFSNARARGLISIESLSQDRVGLYSDRVAHLGGRGWDDIIVAGGLRRSKASSRTYVTSEAFVTDVDLVKLKEIEYLHDEHRGIALEDGAREENLKQIDSSRLASHVLSHSGIPWTREREVFLTTVLEGLKESSEVEIQFRSDRICDKVFARPVRLLTLTALSESTEHLVSCSEYNRYAIIAETGSWLVQRLGAMAQRARDQKKRIEIFLLTAFEEMIYAFDRELAQEDFRWVTLHLRTTRWWRHNQHMTVGIRGDRPQKAIYFSRDKRTQFISPVMLDEQDSELVFRDFLVRWNTEQLERAVEPADVERVRLRDLEGRFIWRDGALRTYPKR